MTTEADIETFQAFNNYDFDNDEKFQFGMSSILKSSEEDPSTHDEVVERAKWFYYTKFIKSFDLETFREWNSKNDSEKSKKETKVESNEDKEKKDDDTPRRFTFQELVEMIETGQEIPGIRQIPNKINEGTPSEAKLSVRQKPWETAAATITTTEPPVTTTTTAATTSTEETTTTTATEETKPTSSSSE
ncbi:hypothetical protein BDA99DRAFT_605780 [Phascolomyces articulosus]|uniref:Uncharacterized protein n=1 Tax=Phascolomyces articulosus TaxID=60185 RepID=A0AAD5JXS5_9FUNG|nr:hypothetical protein BDA99DRAFT_605780 [Phascolomyces articulosus]